MMIKRRNRGFKLGRRLTRIFRWATRKGRKSYRYEKLVRPTLQKSKTFERIYSWGKKIQRGLVNSVKSRGYVRVGDDPVIDSKPSRVPRGHLAVHVEEPEGDTLQVLVPILFLNHPLFGKLLEEAENVYGYDHPGRITIPCPISEFENVSMKIAAGSGKCMPRGYRSGHIWGAECLLL